MRIPRIYTAQALAENSLLTLEPEPSRHLSKALRMKPGASLILFNGQGGEYSAEISAVDRKQVQVRTLAFNSRELESPLAIHLGIAMSRGERMDWIVQKSTELGVASLTPLTSTRAGVQLSGERAEKKERHWQQVAISACEQCGRNRLPVISAIQGINQWLEEVEAQGRFVLHHRATGEGPGATPLQSAALLVGPEGGLDESEIQCAMDRGFQGLSLGPRVLRTETAPLAALAILQATWGDMALS